MKKIFALFVFVTIAVCSFGDSRSEPVDFFILLDKSPSMRDKMDKALSFAARDIIGRYVIANDWVCLISFYGTTNIVFKGPIQSDTDKRNLIQSLNLVKADGKYTDIGNALDELKKEVFLRGMQERPKYILLITDMRQEAPPQSKYQSKDYAISHPSLEYVLKQEIDGLYIITLGFDLDSKIEGIAEFVIKTLSEPPQRDMALLPGTENQTNANQETSSGTMVNTNQEKRQNQITTILFILLGFTILAICIMLYLYFKRKKSESKDEK